MTLLMIGHFISFKHHNAAITIATSIQYMFCASLPLVYVSVEIAVVTVTFKSWTGWHRF